MARRENKLFCKKLYLPDGKDKGQLDKMSRVTASASEINTGLDGLTATATELNLLDGATAANSTAAVGAVLDADGSMRNPTNAGTAGTGVTAVEYGDGFHHLTKLTFSATTLITDPGGAGVNAEGVIIYTFPATGDIIVHSTTGKLGCKAVANAADVPEIGIGSVIATGAIANLSGTATFEDYMTGTAATACSGTDQDAILTSDSTAGGHTILTKGAHKLHFNVCCPLGWTGADATMYPTGVLWVDWSLRIY
jgi:hypothetical protein